MSQEQKPFYDPKTLVNRLRGIYVTAVNDGAGPLDGRTSVVRKFDNLPPIQAEAARRIEELEHQLEGWSRVAVYLAEVHAATAEYDAQLRTVSKSRRQRFALICEKASEFLLLRTVPEKRYASATAPAEVAQRCREAAEKLKNSD